MRIKTVSMFVSRYLEPHNEENYHNGHEHPRIYSDEQAQDLINNVIDELEGLYKVKDIKINEVPMLNGTGTWMHCIRRTYTLLLEEKECKEYIPPVHGGPE